MGGPSGNQGGGGSRDSNRKARKDTDVSGAEAVYSGGTTASDKKISSKSSNNKNKSSDNNTVKQETKNKFTDLTKDVTNPNEDNYQKDKLDNYQIQDSNAPGALGIGLNLTKGARQKTFEVNRDYYQENVGGKEGYTDTFDNYERYIKGRSTGKLDAMGRTIKSSGGNDSKPVTTKSAEQPKVKSQMDNTEIKSDMITADKTSPTDVEVDNNEILLKNKRKGRRKTILTSVTGVEDYPTLSKKTLLGG